MNVEKSQDLAAMKTEDLLPWMKEWRQPAYRAKQIIEWRNRGVLCPDAMTNIPVPLKNRIRENMQCTPLDMAHWQESKDGTRKYLFRLSSGKTIETVYIPEESRATICISTQVGCVFDCPFCHTGTQKFEANLSPGEIVAQILAVKRHLIDTPPPPNCHALVSHIVYMGMGEPLANEDGVHKSLDILIHPQGLGLSRRRITVSTSGIIPAITRLGEAFPVNLAVSLHAANDKLRDELVPINQKYPLNELRKSLNHYPLGKQRHITLEYVMLDGINDRNQDIEDLKAFANAERERVNLIQFNPFPGTAYRPSSSHHVNAFAESLIRANIRTTVRRSRGDDILAACGQLKSSIKGMA